MRTTGKYGSLSHTPVGEDSSQVMEGSDDQDRRRAQLCVNMAEDDRPWATRLFDRCHETFNNHPRVLSAALFVPAVLAFGAGAAAIADDPDDKVTYGLTFACGAFLTTVAALGVWCCRRDRRPVVV